MFEDVAILKKKQVTVDSAGNNIITWTERQVYVMPRSIYQSEFYQAAEAGMRPSLTLVLSNFADYQGEEAVEFQGKAYTITRAYHKPDRDTLELTIEERKING